MNPPNVQAPSDGGFEAFDDRAHAIEIAARNVVAACRDDQFGHGWRPKGVDEVAILLESLGYSPEVVAELWFPSLFDFAREVSRVIDQYISDDERAAQTDVGWFTHACKDYAIGALYSGPWIIAVLGLAVFGAALWSSLSTPVHLATAIAIGAYGALVVSGVFSQTIARRLTFYFLQDNAPLMAWTIERFIGASLVAFLTIGTLMWLLLRLVYNDPDAVLAAAFFVGAGVFQVSLAPLYTMRRFLWIIGVSFVATTLTGLTFVALFKRTVSVPWEPAVLALEVFGCGIAVMTATLIWARRHARPGGKTTSVVPPTTRAIVRSALPYGIFGAAYFAMILVDHLTAGLADGFPFTYRPGYELGTDIALLSIVPVVGVINAALEALPRRILSGAKARLSQARPFDREIVRYYVISALAVTVATLLTVGIAEVGGDYVLRHTLLGLRGQSGEEAAFVLRYSVAGYGVLMLGLLNCQLLFFLSRPRAPVVASVAATGTSVLTGAGLLVTHQPAAYAVFTVDAAIVVFVAITTVAALAAMRNFTFAYYAAY